MKSRDEQPITVEAFECLIPTPGESGPSVQMQFVSSDEQLKNGDVKYVRILGEDGTCVYEGDVIVRRIPESN